MQNGRVPKPLTYNNGYTTIRYVKYFNFIQNGVVEFGPVTKPAEYLHREEVMCPLPRPAPGRNQTVLAHVYSITVSNDGTVFSNPLMVVSYKRECLECSFETCSIKVNHINYNFH